MYIPPPPTINEMLGKTLRMVTQNGNQSIDFEAETGERWVMHYVPDCCAHAEIEDVVGDLQDLVGAPLLMAEESTNSTDPQKALYCVEDSYTWSYYRFATVKGYVTIRWYGSSNGYYAEAAQIDRLP
jgi:hypothetical protein